MKFKLLVLGALSLLTLSELTACSPKARSRTPTPAGVNKTGDVKLPIPELPGTSINIGGQQEPAAQQKSALPYSTKSEEVTTSNGEKTVNYSLTLNVGGTARNVEISIPELRDDSETKITVKNEGQETTEGTAHCQSKNSKGECSTISLTFGGLDPEGKSVQIKMLHNIRRDLTVAQSIGDSVTTFGTAEFNIYRYEIASQESEYFGKNYTQTVINMSSGNSEDKASKKQLVTADGRLTINVSGLPSKDSSGRAVQYKDLTDDQIKLAKVISTSMVTYSVLASIDGSNFSVLSLTTDTSGKELDLDKLPKVELTEAQPTPVPATATATESLTQ